MFLVTTLSSASSSIPIHLFIQRTLEGTPAILAVTNLVRYGKKLKIRVVIFVSHMQYNACRDPK